jgi:glycosyltransferase involved in cell wall biosynthesis
MKEATSQPRHVLILGLDTFARKNIIQIRALEAEGYAFTIVTNDQRGDSRAIFDAQGFAASRLVIVRRLSQKLATAWRLLRTLPLHHVELGAAGRMASAYLLMLKMLRIPVLVIERGDVGFRASYDALTRVNLRLAYRFATRIIYLETYMKALLAGLTDAPLDFIPNCVAPARDGEPRARPVDFLWVNRVIPERKIEWLLDAFDQPPLSAHRLVLLGVEDGELARRRPATANVEIHPFIDPQGYYEGSRFFCLPSSIVFANNSLLEAMAAGVVPVVTEAPGVELLVEDGVNGIVTPFDEDAYREGLMRATALGEDEWRRLSRNAAETVRERYSIEAWTRKMAEVYDRLAA